MTPRLELASENAFLIRFAEHPHADLPARIQAFAQAIQARLGDALQDWVPSYTTLLVVFDLNRIHPEAVQHHLHSLLTQPPAPSQKATRLHHLPVCYDEKHAPDLALLAEHCQCSIDTVIQLHSGATYQVYALGFAPAFAYLGEVDARIAHPRHASPRAEVKAGSVGIADRQTAIYPTASPAGWQIIGRTPLDLSLHQPENLTRFQVGDQVRFCPIDAAQFAQVNALDFKAQTHWLEQFSSHTNTATTGADFEL